MVVEDKELHWFASDDCNKIHPIIPNRTAKVKIQDGRLYVLLLEFKYGKYRLIDKVHVSSEDYGEHIAEDWVL